MATARALRRHMNMDVDSFPHDVVELMAYLSDEGPVGRVQAIPGQGTNVPVWILGSSLYGAQLAAALGLPYAFASHFAPAELDRALEIYRAQFKPSAQMDRPYAMPAMSVIAAETDEEARYLFTSTQQAFVNLRSGRPGPLPRPVEGYCGSPRARGAGDPRAYVDMCGGRIARHRAQGSGRIPGADERRRDHRHCPDP